MTTTGGGMSSSESEHDDYGMAELAVPDGPLLEEEAQDPLFCRLGGYPVYLRAGSEQLFHCGLCSSPLYFVTQLDCSSSSVDKVIYVFACNSAKCSSDPAAWRCFCQQRPRQAVPSSALPKKSSMNFWDDMKELSIEEKAGEPAGFAHVAYPCTFPALALRVVDEFWSEPAGPKHPIVKGADDVHEEGDEDRELYERVQLAGIDKKFERFQRRVAAYPRQCVRFDDRPLPFNDSPLPAACSCPECGEPLAFFLQIMPAVLNFLPVGDEKYLCHIPKDRRSRHPLFGDEMNWGSVFLYRCPHDHIHCHVQHESDVPIPIECIQ